MLKMGVGYTPDTPSDEEIILRNEPSAKGLHSFLGTSLNDVGRLPQHLRQLEPPFG